MVMWNRLIGIIDWFIPSAAKVERSEHSLARNFVFTHLFGPALSQSISLFLYLSDAHPGLACWTVIVCIWLFWTLPLRYELSDPHPGLECWTVIVCIWLFWTLPFISWRLQPKHEPALRFSQTFWPNS